VEIEERPSEPVLCFLADKTEPGAWNLPCTASSPTRSALSGW
jgi:fructose 1,6-bisphosphate aldolase/phosphatase